MVMTMRKSDAALFLTEHGIVVEGTETSAELQEAVRNVKDSIKAGWISE